jgi:hypothetical protein
VLVGNATIAANPFYYGVPSLTFTGLTGLNETKPSDAISQAISFSDFVSWSHKKHNLRFGGDFRRVHADSLTAPGNLQSGASPLGAFTFTGYATQHATAGTDLSRRSGYGLLISPLWPSAASGGAGRSRKELSACKRVGPLRQR